MVPVVLLHSTKHGKTMKTINNWEELLEYLNRLGVVNRHKPIGWRQEELMTILVKIESHVNTMPKYPFKIKYLRAMSRTSLNFKINHYQVRLRFS